MLCLRRTVYLRKLRNFALSFGKGDEAVVIAEKSIADGFEIPNAYAELTVKAVEKKDKEFGQKLLTSFLNSVKDIETEEQQRYFNAVKNRLEDMLGST